MNLCVKFLLLFSAGLLASSEVGNAALLESVNGFPMEDLSHCQYSFLDVGSNIGVHSRFLFEPEKYKRSKYVKNVFGKFFPQDRRSSSICAFLFEPNPTHLDRMKKLEAHHHANGRYARTFNVGLSNYTGNTVFHTVHDKGEVGFSAVSRYKKFSTLNVTLVEINQMLRHLTSLGLKSKVVVMKMDVEGSEYLLLRNLLKSGLICSVITHLTIEFHLAKVPCYPREFNCESVQKAIGTTLKFLATDPECSLEYFTVLDDETYAFDERPMDVA